MTKELEIPKCPVCEGEMSFFTVTLQSGDNKYHLTCRNTECSEYVFQHDGYSDKKQAIEAWNNKVAKKMPECIACGNSMNIYRHKNGYCLHCDYNYCHVTLRQRKFYPSPEEAIKAWNKYMKKEII